MKQFAISIALVVFCVCALPSKADNVVVDTGLPDGKIATASQPSSPGKTEIESADDFLLTQTTSIGGGTFIGLIPAGATVESVTIEFYQVFPADSTSPPNPQVVPTRNNSPSDVEFADRSTTSSNLAFTTTILNQSFTASNSVVNGIHCSGSPPNCFTGGEGPVTGQEVEFAFSIDPESLPADHYFFVPQVELSDGTFLWLSAPKPIGAGGTPFLPDLQTWIRNSDLDPNWLRVGTDITGQGPFNASFSLTSAPEPSTLLLTAAGMLGLILKRRKRAFRQESM
jgi:hypothetical protein